MQLFKKTFIRVFLLFAIVLVFSTMVRAAIVDTYEFKNKDNQQRAVALAKDLRCPQCQNQNLVESTSPIAYDLRLKVYQMVDEGKSNQAIIDTMTERYGDFVLYDPPFNWHTALLWLGPLILLMFGGVALIILRGDTPISQKPTYIIQQRSNEPLWHKMSVRKLRWLKASIFLMVCILPAAGYVISPHFQEVKTNLEKWQHEKTDIQTPEEIYAEQIKSLQTKLTNDPNNGENWYALGEAYISNNEFANALESFRRAEYLLGSKSYILSSAALAIYYEHGQHITGQVKKLLDKALEQDSQDSTSLLLLATDAFMQTNYATAIEYWKRALDSERSNLERRKIIKRIHMAKSLTNKDRS